MKNSHLCLALALSSTLLFTAAMPAQAQLVSGGITISEVDGQNVITGTGEYDQVNYDGKLADYTFTRNADNSVSVARPDGKIDRLILIDGFWFIGEEKWYAMSEVLYSQAGDQTITGTPDDYDQVDYPGSAADYNFVRNDDLSVTVTKPNGTRDTLIDIDGFWFLDEEAWYAINSLAERVVGGRTYTGSPDAYDQVDYPTGALDYEFRVVTAGTVEVTNRGNDNVDTLIDIDGIWFQEEEQWYSIFDLTSQSGQTYTGTDEYDQVDYPGSLADYIFTQNSDGSVSAEKPNGTTDTLINIDGFWFGGEEAWYSIEDALAPPPPPPPPVPTDPYLEPDHPSYFGEIVLEKRSGFCLTTATGNTGNEVTGDVFQSACTGAANQRYSFAPYQNYYQIRSENGQCLGVAGSSNSLGANIREFSCSFDDNMLWSVAGTGNSQTLVAKHSGKCAHIEESGATPNNVHQWDCVNSLNEQWRIDAPLGDGKLRFNSNGLWEGPYRMPLVPSAAAILPDGKVVTWSAYAKMTFGGNNGRTATSIFDPVTKTATDRNVSNTSHDMFCPGTTMLSDGRLMVTGGSSDRVTSIYNPATDQWSRDANLNTPRGYHAMTPLSDGRVLALGGSWSGARANKPGEVWSEGSGWQSKSGLADTRLYTADPEGYYRSDNHMWLFQAPNGKVFHPGPARNSNWIDVNGNGTVTPSVARGDDVDALNGNAVMYDVGKILAVGGSTRYTGFDASKRAYVFDINGGEGGVTVKRIADMAFKRVYANSVVLPSGDVIVIGGQEFGKQFTDEKSVFTVEMWNPETETFSQLADMRVPRNYHSIAILMKDGRVLTGGGGLCGSCTANHADVEIFTPPYLLGPDGALATRPVLSNVPAQARPGNTISVDMDTDTSHSFALVRTAAVTHSVNNDERRIPLQATAQGGGTFSLSLPSSANVLIPGNYFLFAMNASGVPSVGEIINVPAN